MGLRYSTSVACWFDVHVAISPQRVGVAARVFVRTIIAPWRAPTGVLVVRVPPTEAMIANEHFLAWGHLPRFGLHAIAELNRGAVQPHAVVRKPNALCGDAHLARLASE